MIEAGFATGPSDWKAALAPLVEAGEADIQFTQAYASLYAGPERRAGLFHAGSGECRFVLPLIVERASALGPRDAFDVSSPYGYSGPLSTSRDPGFLAEAWERFFAWCAQAGVIAGFIRFHPLTGNDALCVDDRIEVTPDREVVVLSTRRERDEVVAAYRGDTRRKVRKAAREGVVVAKRSDEQAIMRFARFYRARMSELGAAEEYHFSDAYFAGIAAMAEPSRAVYEAVLDETVIGGALVLYGPRFIHYHLSATPKSNQGAGANNAMRDAVIADALNAPQSHVIFGGGRGSDPEDSLLRFKAGFSDERAMFHIGRFIADRPAYEALCGAWAQANPDSARRYAGRVLRYKHVDG